MIGWRTWGILQGLLALFVCACAHAQLLHLTDASSGEKLDSRIGLGIEQPGASFRADMRLMGEPGQIRLLPRVSSAWSGAQGLDISTVLSYPDLNQSAVALRPTLESKLVFRPDLSYISDIEANVRRTNGATHESFQLSFSDLDTGWRLLGGDPLAIKTNFTMRQHGADPELGSRITSGLGIGSGLAVQTTVQLRDGNSMVLPQSVIDTKLIYRSPIPFISRFEGDLRRSALGETRQSVSILFPEVSSSTSLGPSFKLSTAATLAERTAPNGLETRMVGVETKFSSTMLPWVGGRNALKLRMEHSLDAYHQPTSTLAYDHSWMPADTTSIGLNFELKKHVEQVEALMDLRWTAQF